MFNQIILVGRISDLQADYSQDRLNGCVTIAVERAFAESNGEYLTDYFDIQLWRGMVETLRDDYRPGDLIAVNGRIQNDGSKEKLQLIAEKISLIRRSEARKNRSA